MDNITVNIYWNDLSAKGQDTLADKGFNITKSQISNQIPLGAIATNIDEFDLDGAVDIWKNN